MAETQKQFKLVTHSKHSAQGTDFIHRESSELVIGISGAVGSGVEFVVASLRRTLEGLGYTVFHLKLSKFLDGFLNRKLVREWKSEYDQANRYERLQRAGNLLRSERSNDFLAELAIAVISNHRVAVAEQTTDRKFENLTDIVPGRVAYIVDQLKHPDEVQLLRRVYGNLFYLVGVLASEQQRIKNLRREMPPNEVTEVVERDRQDDEKSGQQLDKTLKLADFFLRNNQQNDKSLDRPLERFLALVHGQTSRTPTKDEYAMFAAYSAGLRSACLSRQVGAAITDAHGNVIATGCNDVPKAHGGLYSEDDDDADYRCVYLQGGVCFNASKKDELTAKIQETLERGGIVSDEAKKLASAIRNQTRLKDLTEFSRSVHAEMDALISIARKGGPSVLGGNLYTTTYPCHNCARHIVAAGIRTVFYVEPYEKSLALELHSDAIAADSESPDPRHVTFLHFEGVAPRQYQNLFVMMKDRKDRSRAIKDPPSQSRKTAIQYLDSYRDLETKVVENLFTQGLSKAELIELADPVIN